MDNGCKDGVPTGYGVQIVGTVNSYWSLYEIMKKAFARIAVNANLMILDMAIHVYWSL